MDSWLIYWKRKVWSYKVNATAEGGAECFAAGWGTAGWVEINGSMVIIRSFFKSE